MGAEKGKPLQRKDFQITLYQFIWKRNLTNSTGWFLIYLKDVLIKRKTNPQCYKGEVAWIQDTDNYWHTYTTRGDVYLVTALR